MTTKTSDEEIARLVKEFHFNQGMSLRRIERDNNLANDTIRKRCIKLNIKTKSRKQSICDNEKYVTRPSGDTHWGKLNTEAWDKKSRESSTRMSKNNPIHKDGVAELIAKTNSKKWKEEPTLHESLIITLFDSLNVPYDFQMPVSKYVPDFVVYGNIIVEIDGRGHASRKTTDRIRDKALCDIGFFVVRINQDLLFNKRLEGKKFRPNKLISVIEDIAGVSDLSCKLPPITCKHRVIVRKPNPFTEIIY